MTTRRIRIGLCGQYAVVDSGDIVFRERCFVSGLCIVLGIAAALVGAWLIWQVPHCRPVAAHAYYTPFAAAQCAPHARKDRNATGAATSRASGAG